MPTETDLNAREASIERYPEVERFAGLMLSELAANSGKGDQAGWLAAPPRALLHDITWHWAKLARALSAFENAVGHKAQHHHADEVREYAADVANMAMMLVDRLGLLPEGAPDV